MRPEHQVLASEIRDIFQRSLQEFPSPAECAEFWGQLRAREKAIEFIRLNNIAADDARDGRVRFAVLNDPSFVHIFWLLDIQTADVRQYLNVLLDKSVTRSFPQTKFWAAYSCAIATFCGLSVDATPKPKLVGYERFWEPYLDFMAGNISRDDFETRAAASFSARNHQSKCIDWQSLDGDAKNSVRWDFRYASIGKGVGQGAESNSLLENRPIA